MPMKLNISLPKRRMPAGGFLDSSGSALGGVITNGRDWIFTKYDIRIEKWKKMEKRGRFRASIDGCMRFGLKVRK